MGEGKAEKACQERDDQLMMQLKEFFLKIEGFQVC